MAKKKSYQVQQKKSKENKNKQTLQGGYMSSLAGVNQSDRAEMYKLNRRGAGVFENKKRKQMLKPKHKKNSRDYSDSCVIFFVKKHQFNSVQNLKIVV